MSPDRQTALQQAVEVVCMLLGPLAKGYLAKLSAIASLTRSLPRAYRPDRDLLVLPGEAGD